MESVALIAEMDDTPLTSPTRPPLRNAGWGRIAPIKTPPIKTPLVLALLLVGVFYLGVFRHIDLPGLYMDAVNPDYLAARILNPAAAQLPAWFLPSNILDRSNRFPALPALYHGSQNAFFGLPAFWLFGTNIVALRLFHAAFGAGILVAGFLTIARLSGSRGLAFLAMATLALDSAFLMSFRTQSAITLGGLVWLLLSVHRLLPKAGHGQDAEPVGIGSLLASGALYGFAVYSYFIFGFFGPALLLMVWLRLRTGRPSARARLGALAAWGAGIVLGWLPSLFGYASIAVIEGGFRKFLTFVSSSAGSLGAFGSALSLGDRLAYLGQMIEWEIGNVFNADLMFQDQTPLPFTPLKAALLLGVPAAVLAVGLFRKNRAPLRSLVPGYALLLSFTAVGLIFGNRLNGHHYIVLLPILYLVLALATGVVRGRWAEREPAGSGWLTHAPLGVFVLLAGINGIGQNATMERLWRTGGVGLYSDAINVFAAEALRNRRQEFLFFPDWGLYMPFLFLTRGEIPFTMDPTPEQVRKRLCRGQDVTVVLVGADRQADFDTLSQRFDWPAPAVTPYRQRNGVTVFQAGTFAAAPCAAGG